MLRNQIGSRSVPVMETRNYRKTLGSIAFRRWLDRQEDDQKTLAGRFGVSASTVTRWASGEVVPSDESKSNLRVWTGGEVHPMLWLEPAERDDG